MSKAMGGASNKVCASCQKTLTGAINSRHSRCSRCKQIYYCNRSCQINHWKREHKTTCVPHIQTTPKETTKLEQYKQSYSPQTTQRWIVKANLNIPSISRQLCTTGCYTLKHFCTEIIGVDESLIHYLNNCALHHNIEGMATLWGTQGMGLEQGVKDSTPEHHTTLQTIHGRLTTLMTGLRRMHPILNDVFQTSGGMSAVVLNFDTIKTQTPSFVSIPKPKLCTGGVFVLLSSGTNGKSGTHHVQRRKYQEAVVPASAILFNCSFHRTHVRIDVPQNNHQGMCWVGLFIYYFNAETSDKNIAVALQEWKPTLCPDRTAQTQNIDWSSLLNDEKLIQRIQKQSEKEGGKRPPKKDAIKAKVTIDQYDEFVAEQETLYDAVTDLFSAEVGHHASHQGRETLAKDKQESSSFFYGEIRFRTFSTGLIKCLYKYGGIKTVESKSSSISNSSSSISGTCKIPGIGNIGRDSSGTPNMRQDNSIHQSPSTTGTTSQGNGVFYDLGSGTGKAVVAAALLYPFNKSIGIELLPSLHEQSIKVLQQFQEKRTNFTTQVSTQMGDICNIAWWEDADVIYCNTLAFTEELLTIMRALMCKVKAGTFVMTTGRLNDEGHMDDAFVCLEYAMQPFSWGMSTLWLHQRK